MVGIPIIMGGGVGAVDSLEATVEAGMLVHIDAGASTSGTSKSTLQDESKSLRVSDSTGAQWFASLEAKATSAAAVGQEQAHEEAAATCSGHASCQACVGWGSTNSGCSWCEGAQDGTGGCITTQIRTFEDLKFRQAKCPQLVGDLGSCPATMAFAAAGGQQPCASFVGCSTCAAKMGCVWCEGESVCVSEKVRSLDDLVSRRRACGSLKGNPAGCRSSEGVANRGGSSGVDGIKNVTTRSVAWGSARVPGQINHEQRLWPLPATVGDWQRGSADVATKTKGTGSESVDRSRESSVKAFAAGAALCTTYDECGECVASSLDCTWCAGAGICIASRIESMADMTFRHENCSAFVTASRQCEGGIDTLNDSDNMLGGDDFVPAVRRTEEQILGASTLVHVDGGQFGMAGGGIANPAKSSGERWDMAEMCHAHDSCDACVAGVAGCSWCEGHGCITSKIRTFDDLKFRQAECPELASDMATCAAVATRAGKGRCATLVGCSACVVTPGCLYCAQEGTCVDEQVETLDEIVLRRRRCGTLASDPSTCSGAPTLNIGTTVGNGVFRSVRGSVSAGSADIRSMDIRSRAMALKAGDQRHHGIDLGVGGAVAATAGPTASSISSNDPSRLVEYRGGLCPTYEDCLECASNLDCSWCGGGGGEAGRCMSSRVDLAADLSFRRDNCAELATSPEQCHASARLGRFDGIKTSDNTDAANITGAAARLRLDADANMLVQFGNRFERNNYGPSLDETIRYGSSVATSGNFPHDFLPSVTERCMLPLLATRNVSPSDPLLASIDVSRVVGKDQRPMLNGVRSYGLATPLLYHWRMDEHRYDEAERAATASVNEWLQKQLRKKVVVKIPKGKLLPSTQPYVVSLVVEDCRGRLSDRVTAEFRVEDAPVPLVRIDGSALVRDDRGTRLTVSFTSPSRNVYGYRWSARRHLLGLSSDESEVDLDELRVKDRTLLVPGGFLKAEYVYTFTVAVSNLYSPLEIPVSESFQMKVVRGVPPPKVQCDFPSSASPEVGFRVPTPTPPPRTPGLAVRINQDDPSKAVPRALDLVAWATPVYLDDEANDAVRTATHEWTVSCRSCAVDDEGGGFEKTTKGPYLEVGANRLKPGAVYLFTVSVDLGEATADVGRLVAHLDVKMRHTSNSSAELLPVSDLLAPHIVVHTDLGGTNSKGARSDEAVVAFAELREGSVQEMCETYFEWQVHSLHANDGSHHLESKLELYGTRANALSIPPGVLTAGRVYWLSVRAILPHGKAKLPAVLSKEQRKRLFQNPGQQVDLLSGFARIEVGASERPFFIKIERDGQGLPLVHNDISFKAILHGVSDQEAAAAAVNFTYKWSLEMDRGGAEGYGPVPLRASAAAGQKLVLPRFTLEQGRNYKVSVVAQGGDDADNSGDPGTARLTDSNYFRVALKMQAGTVEALYHRVQQDTWKIAARDFVGDYALMPYTFNFWLVRANSTLGLPVTLDDMRSEFIVDRLPQKIGTSLHFEARVVDQQGQTAHGRAHYVVNDTLPDFKIEEASDDCESLFVCDNNNGDFAACDKAAVDPFLEQCDDDRRSDVDRCLTGILMGAAELVEVHATWRTCTSKLNPKAAQLVNARYIYRAEYLLAPLFTLELSEVNAKQVIHLLHYLVAQPEGLPIFPMASARTAHEFAAVIVDVLRIALMAGRDLDADCVACFQPGIAQTALMVLSEVSEFANSVCHMPGYYGRPVNGGGGPVLPSSASGRSSFDDVWPGLAAGTVFGGILGGMSEILGNSAIQIEHAARNVAGVIPGVPIADDAIEGDAAARRLGAVANVQKYADKVPIEDSSSSRGATKTAPAKRRLPDENDVFLMMQRVRAAAIELLTATMSCNMGGAAADTWNELSGSTMDSRSSAAWRSGELQLLAPQLIAAAQRVSTKNTTTITITIGAARARGSQAEQGTIGEGGSNSGAEVINPIIQIPIDSVPQEVLGGNAFLVYAVAHNQYCSLGCPNIGSPIVHLAFKAASAKSSVAESVGDIDTPILVTLPADPFVADGHSHLGCGSSSMGNASLWSEYGVQTFQARRPVKKVKGIHYEKQTCLVNAFPLDLALVNRCLKVPAVATHTSTNPGGDEEPDTAMEPGDAAAAAISAAEELTSPGTDVIPPAVDASFPSASPSPSPASPDHPNVNLDKQAARAVQKSAHEAPTAAVHSQAFAEDGEAEGNDENKVQSAGAVDVNAGSKSMLTEKKSSVKAGESADDQDVKGGKADDGKEASSSGSSGGKKKKSKAFSDDDEDESSVDSSRNRPNALGEGIMPPYTTKNLEWLGVIITGTLVGMIAFAAIFVSVRASANRTVDNDDEIDDEDDDYESDGRGFSSPDDEA